MERLGKITDNDQMRFMRKFRIGFLKRRVSIAFAREEQRKGFRGVQLQYESERNSTLSVKTWVMGWLETSGGRMRAVYFHRNQLLKKVT